MYLEFLGLKNDPFKSQPDGCYFMNKTHQAFLEQVEKTDKDLLIVLGEAGIGKSGLAEKIKGIYVDAGRVLPETILEKVAFEAGFDSFKDMIEQPEKKAPKGKGTIIIDSANFLDVQALQDILRLLMTRKEKIILFALPNFYKKLKHPDLRSLRERADYLFFPSLTKEEGIGYIHYRIWFHKEESEYARLMDEPAAYYIARKGCGNPLKINQISEEALKNAAEEGVRHVTLAHARKAHRSVRKISVDGYRLALISSVVVNILLILWILMR